MNPSTESDQAHEPCSEGRTPLTGTCVQRMLANLFYARAIDESTSAARKSTEP